MGVSTDAMLFYGYHLPEDTKISPELHDTYYTDEPVQLGVHCSNEFPLYYVFVQDSQTVAGRGTPKRITNMATAQYGAEVGQWDTLIKAFIIRHDLIPPGGEIEYGGHASELGWWLASYWG